MSFFKQIILIVVAAIIGFLINHYTDHQETAIEYLEYWVNSTNDVLERFTTTAPQITLNIGDWEIRDVTEVEVLFINKTSSDFENVPIFIDFIDRGSGKFRLIGQSIVGENGLKEIVKNVKIHQRDSTGNVIRCSFALSLINRMVGWDWQSIPRATFLFTGDIAPTVDIKTSRKGVLTKVYDPKEYVVWYKKRTSHLVFVALGFGLFYWLCWMYEMRKVVDIKKKEILATSRFLLANGSIFDMTADNTAEHVAMSLYLAMHTDFDKRFFEQYVQKFVADNAHILKNPSEETVMKYAQILIFDEYNTFIESKNIFWCILTFRRKLRVSDIS